jgi:hypothetical protein
VLVPAGHAGTRPAHHPHGGAMIHPQLQQDRGGRVTGIVQAGVPYAGIAKQTLPAELIDSCVELPSQLVGEDPTLVVPEVPRLRSLGSLLLAVSCEFDGPVVSEVRWFVCLLWTWCPWYLRTRRPCRSTRLRPDHLLRRPALATRNPPLSPTATTFPSSTVGSRSMSSPTATGCATPPGARTSYVLSGRAWPAMASSTWARSRRGHVRRA